MSPRTKERTATLPAEDVAAWKSAFGTTTHAFRMVVRLLPPEMPWTVFKDVISGRPSRPDDIDAVQQAWRNWKAAPK